MVKLIRKAQNILQEKFYNIMKMKHRDIHHKNFTPVSYNLKKISYSAFMHSAYYNKL